jgi:hypothetical protein
MAGYVQAGAEIRDPDSRKGEWVTWADPGFISSANKDGGVFWPRHQGGVDKVRIDPQVMAAVASPCLDNVPTGS